MVGRDFDVQAEVVVGQYLGWAGMGGAEVYAAHIANMHAEEGGQSHVLIRSKPGPLSNRFSEKVHIHYMNYARSSIRKPVAFVRSIFRGYSLLCNQIEASGIEVLHTHLPDENLWGLVVSLTGKCKVVITIHNNNFLASPDGTKAGKFVTKLAYKMMIKHCAAVIVVSEEVGESFKKLLKVSEPASKKISVIYNGVLIPENISKIEINETRDKYGVSSMDFWIVAAGRLSEAKNFSCLLRAVEELKSRGVNVKVTIGGEGNLRPELEQEIKARGLVEDVSLPGILDDLQDMMRSADLLAMPSLWEGLPLTLLEAMACGLPVVGTLINGLKEVVDDGKHGYLVAVDDHHAFADRIEKMILQPDKRKEMGQKSRELIVKQYSFSRVYSQLNDVYSKALEDG